LSDLDVLLLLQFEDVAVELLLQFLVGVVDAELTNIPISFIKKYLGTYFYILVAWILMYSFNPSF
jgi:hypothetical protein